MTTALQTKQNEFVTSFNQWRSLVYKLLREKKMRNTIRNPKYLDELVDRFQGHLWAVYDRFDPHKACFSTWLEVEFNAFWSARARALNMGRGPDSEDVGRTRRKNAKAHRRTEPYRKKSMDFVPVGLPSHEEVEKGELSEEGFHRLRQPGHLPSTDAVLSLRDCVARLSKEDQELLRLIESSDKSRRSIAISMGVLPQTLDGRVNKIYKDLRSLMKTGQPATQNAKRNPKPINAQRYSKYSDEEWKEYFKTELVFLDHIYRELYEKERKAA